MCFEKILIKQQNNNQATKRSRRCAAFLGRWSWEATLSRRSRRSSGPCSGTRTHLRNPCHPPPRRTGESPAASQPRNRSPESAHSCFQSRCPPLCSINTHRSGLLHRILLHCTGFPRIRSIPLLLLNPLPSRKGGGADRAAPKASTSL